MLMEPGEREDAFFRYDNGTMVQLNGYYIYYEKNSQMQTYMIERNQRKGQETSEKVEDKAVRNFRKIIDSKKPEEREEENFRFFLCCYSMSGFGCSCGRCKFLSESAGKRRNPGRFPRNFRSCGTDDAGNHS